MVRNIAGPGTETSDSIPIMASKKEWVIKAASAKKYGGVLLSIINNGTFSNIRVKMLKFARGAAVGDAGATAAGRFAADFGANISALVHIANYVDGC
jgi:hypothetical protein